MLAGMCAGDQRDMGSMSLRSFGRQYAGVATLYDSIRDADAHCLAQSSLVTGGMPTRFKSGA